MFVLMLVVICAVLVLALRAAAAKRIDLALVWIGVIFLLAVATRRAVG